MKYLHFSLSLAAGCILLTSCVSKKQFVGLQENYNKLQADNTDLQHNLQASQIQLAESRANAKSLEDRLAEARKNNEELRTAYAALQGSLDNSIQQN